VVGACDVHVQVDQTDQVLDTNWGGRVATRKWRTASGKHLANNPLAQGNEDGTIDVSLSPGTNVHARTRKGEATAHVHDLTGAH
jgi:hypothetical protein